MAVTTYTNQNLTLIREDGSDPTGSGGKIINDNFKKIDEALFSGTSAIVEYARNANYAVTASQASYADYAYSCAHGSGGSSGVGGYASLPGYADPWYSHPYAEDNSSWPISIWGGQSTAYMYSTSGYSGNQVWRTSDSPYFACIPPFGPFSLRVNMVFYSQWNYTSAIFAEVFICGWNLDIFAVDVLHAYDVNGNQAVVNSHTSLDIPVSSGTAIGASINGGRLMLAAHCDGDSLGNITIHARVENTFPSSSDEGCYSGYSSSGSSS